MVRYNILFFLSRFAALVYEVSWNRQFGLLFGLTSQAAAIVLAASFGGMAIGYAVGAWISNRRYKNVTARKRWDVRGRSWRLERAALSF